MRIFLVILLLPITLFGQRLFSKDEDNYQNSHRPKAFVPTPIDDVRSAQYKYFRILSGNGKQYENNLNATLSEKIESDIGFLTNFSGTPIPRKAICKYSNGVGTTAILFLDSKYDEFQWSEPGYWIRIENARDSTDYYTGLAQNYYLKLFDTGVNIWKNDSTLQFAALRVRLVEPFVHPIMAAKYETIDNNLAAEITLSDLIRDSDGDGLTDIEEEKLMLNSRSADTDSDGKNDLRDPNPRFKSTKSPETLLYEAILGDHIYIDGLMNIRGDKLFVDGKLIDKNKPDTIDSPFRHPYLIVTDNKHLQSIEVGNMQTIILSSDEHKLYRTKFPVTIDEITVTPLFKVNNEVNKFLISKYSDLGGEKYLVVKVKTGYDITIVETWIH